VFFSLFRQNSSVKYSNQGLSLFRELSRIKGITMGLSMSKAKSISGLALITAVVAGCGGGGGGTPAASSPPAGGPPAGGFTQGTTVCAAVANPETVASSAGALLGSCEQYEGTSSPTRAATAFRSPTGTQPVVFYSDATGYEINLPLVSATKTTLVLANLIPASDATSFGSFVGTTYGVSDLNTGSGARVYDHRTTKNLTGDKTLVDLTYSRFGIFNRFTDRTLGYYGGWAQAANQGNLPSGTVTFTGPIVGVIGPASTNTAIGTAAGYSATVTIEVNFATPGTPITKLMVSGFGYSANGGQIVTQPVASGTAVVTSPALDVTGKSLSTSFTLAASGTANAISEGRLSGSFSGAAGASVTEFVGTLKFRTADGRNAIGAFGAR
jgi:hypothetical protein